MHLFEDEIVDLSMVGVFLSCPATFCEGGELVGWRGLDGWGWTGSGGWGSVGFSVLLSPIMSTSAQLVYEVFDHQKSDLLIHCLEEDPDFRAVMVFLKTREGVHALTSELGAAGVSVESIHGSKKPELRNRAIKHFNEGRLRVLVTTDAVARELDLSGVVNSVQFDFPELEKDYLHRIEMAEASKGVVISLVTPKDGNALRKLGQWCGAELEPVKVAGFAYDSQPAKVKPPRRKGAKARGLRSVPLQNKKPKFKKKRGR